MFKLHAMTGPRTLGRVSQADAARLLLSALLIASIVANALWAFREPANLRDFGSFIVSGKAYELGFNPYGIYEEELAPGAEVFSVTLGDWEVDSVNLNPPVSVYGFRYLADVDGELAKQILAVGSLVLYLGIVGRLLLDNPQHLRPLPVLVLLNLAGIWQVAELGQIYVPLMAALVTSWYLLQRGRTSLAGIPLGLVIAVKPPFAIVALLLLLAGHRRPGVISLALAGAISLLPLLIDGTTPYRQWFDISREITPILMEGPGNSSLAGLTSRVADPNLGMAAAAVLLGVALWKTHRLQPDAMACYSLGIVLVCLIGPLTWAGYALFLLPVLLSRPWGRWEWLAITIFSVPVWLVIETFTSPAGELLLGSVYFWGFAILLVLLLRELPGRYRPRTVFSDRTVKDCHGLPASQ